MIAYSYKNSISGLILRNSEFFNGTRREMKTYIKKLKSLGYFDIEIM